MIGFFFLYFYESFDEYKNHDRIPDTVISEKNCKTAKLNFINFKATNNIMQNRIKGKFKNTFYRFKTLA